MIRRRVNDLYASLVVAYSKSNVLLSLMRHLIYFVNVGSAESREARLRSVEVMIELENAVSAACCLRAILMAQGRHREYKRGGFRVRGGCVVYLCNS